MAEQQLEAVAGVGLGRKGGCIHGRLSRPKQGCEEAKQRTGRPEVALLVVADGGGWRWEERAVLRDGGRDGDRAMG